MHAQPELFASVWVRIGMQDTRQIILRPVLLYIHSTAIHFSFCSSFSSYISSYTSLNLVLVQ